MVAINDDGATYLGIESDADVLSADLIGFTGLLDFHVYDGTIQLNKIGGTATDKIDWVNLSTTGLTLAPLTMDDSLDLHADGSVALDALSGTLVAVGSFNLSYNFV